MTSPNLDELWNSVLDLLKGELTTLSFDTWFAGDTRIASVQHDTMVIEVANSFTKNHIKDNYYDTLSNCITKVFNKTYTLKIVSVDEHYTPEATDSNMPLDDDDFFSQDYVDIRTNLVPNYVFDTFVVGNSNRLAHAASVAVAESPATAYNPLFLYGGAGLGKTHLMHSIAHYILDKDPSTRVLYATSEKFTNELINSIRDDKNEEFRQKYRNIDILLIDDIQFITGKERTQEEFFHTFNALYESNKQIIICSDRPPKEIKTLEERLRSRFEWGLIADIQSPEFETRVAILRKKAELDHISIPEDVLYFIAKIVTSNIRELEGALTRILAFSQLTNRPIDVDLATEALKDIISNDQPKVLTAEYILNTVCSYFGLEPEELLSSKRTKNIAYPRQIAMYLCRKHTELSLPKIGEKLGGRDHTTVLHGYEKIANSIEKDIELSQILKELEGKLTTA